MSKIIGIIVDGPGDYASLRIRYKDRCKILKTDGPRGHTVSPNQIVASSRKQCKILEAFNCTKIIVLTDFESRQTNYHKFIGDLEKAFLSLKLNLKVEPCSPNTMIENWYLADIEQLSKKKAFLRDRIKQKKYEGKHGKKELKKFVKKGYSYNEIHHGPQLFIAIRLAVARKNSPSFNHFLNSLAS